MKPSPNRPVYETIRCQRAAQAPSAEAEAAVEEAIGSRGWHTRGYLPHFDKPGLLQMVTFRLADAMPAARRHEWEGLLTLEDERERRTKLEAYLDRGYGECLLKDDPLAHLVEEVLLYHDGQRYRLAAWVVMPNHVHVLFEQWLVPAPEQLKAWKGVSSWAINCALGRSGPCWQDDYWDRYMRDEEHFRKAQRYVESNPVKAHLVQVSEAWPFSSRNPKWQWSRADRYRAAHLLNKPQTWVVERLLAAARTKRQVRSADNPVRRPSATQADRIVRAPILAPLADKVYIKPARLGPRGGAS